MARIYDCCGGRGKHLGGCAKGKSRKKKTPSADVVKGHEHDYTIDKVGIVKDKVTHRTKGYMKTYKCLNNEDGKCPKPTYQEFEPI